MLGSREVPAGAGCRSFAMRFPRRFAALQPHRGWYMVHASAGPGLRMSQCSPRRFSMLSSTSSDQTAAQALASTGVEGLDHILGGGLTANRVYLIEGIPGAGDYARVPVPARRRAAASAPVHRAFGNRRRDRAVAVSHGWSLTALPARARPHGRQPSPKNSTRCFTLRGRPRKRPSGFSPTSKS